MGRNSVVVRYADLRFGVLAPASVCDALAGDPTVERTPGPTTDRSGGHDVVVSRVVDGYLIEGGDEREVLQTDSPASVAESVRVLCNRLTVLGRSDEWTLHAGCVALGETALALMAPSGTGKSTLTAFLVSRGWDYLSDELARIEPGAAHVKAFPKPMNLSDASLGLIGVERLVPRPGGNDGGRGSSPTERWGAYSAEDIGGSTRSDPCPLGAIAVLSRPGSAATEPRIEAMGGAARAAAILANQTNFFETGDAMDKVHQLVTTVPMAGVIIGDLPQTERVLRAWLASEPRPIDGVVIDLTPPVERRSFEPSMAAGPMSLPLRSATAAAIEFVDGTALLVDRAGAGYLVTQAWALRLLERADGASTIERLACDSGVPTSAAVEFFRGAEFAGLLSHAGALVGSPC